MNHYPIRAVSELTGVATTTLRAWERRYGLLNPERSASGHRLYSSRDIESVKEIVSLMKNGHSISDAVRISRSPESQTTSATDHGHWADYQRRILAAIENFNEQNIDTVYNEALSIYPVDLVTKEIILPLLTLLGERWQDRDAGIAEEHFFSSYLRNKLGARLHHESQRNRGRRLLVACLPGEYHELGILLFCIAAIGHGYQVLYLGADMPLSQLRTAAARTRASAILLSGSRPELWHQGIGSELQEMIAACGVPVMFGGELSEINRTDLESIGGHALGPDHVRALEMMEQLVPAFGRPVYDRPAHETQSPS